MSHLFRPLTAIHGMLQLTLLCAFAAIAGAEFRLSPSDLTKESILPNSTSPNSQLCFIEGFNGPTTMTTIVLAATDLSRVLANTDLHTLYSTDKPYKGRITILWSPDSTRVATHDNINKHSTLSVLRSSGGTFTDVPIPDLLQAACLKWGVNREHVISSGQRPSTWTGNDIITVEVTAKLNEGKKHAMTIQLQVPTEGPATIKSK